MRESDSPALRIDRDCARVDEASGVQHLVVLSVQVGHRDDVELRVAEVQVAPHEVHCQTLRRLQI